MNHSRSDHNCHGVAVDVFMRIPSRLRWEEVQDFFPDDYKDPSMDLIAPDYSPIAKRSLANMTYDEWQDWKSKFCRWKKRKKAKTPVTKAIIPQKPSPPVPARVIIPPKPSPPVPVAATPRSTYEDNPGYPCGFWPLIPERTVTPMPCPWSGYVFTLHRFDIHRLFDPEGAALVLVTCPSDPPERFWMNQKDIYVNLRRCGYSAVLLEVQDLYLRHLMRWEAARGRSYIKTKLDRRP
jgi:hypothetical protein